MEQIARTRTGGKRRRADREKIYPFSIRTYPPTPSRPTIHSSPANTIQPLDPSEEKPERERERERERESVRKDLGDLRPGKTAALM